MWQVRLDILKHESTYAFERLGFDLREVLSFTRHGIQRRTESHDVALSNGHNFNGHWV
jgi:hypothetical protein